MAVHQAIFERIPVATLSHPDRVLFAAFLDHLSAFHLIAIFSSALILAASGTLWLVKRRGVIGLDKPDARRKRHEKPIPRLGGLPIFVTLMIGIGAGISILDVSWSRWQPVILCNTLIFLVGFADDVKPLGARVKLAGQLGTALILYALGISIDVLSNPFGQGSINLGWLSLPLTLVWLVAIPNIVNLIDGMDGLAAGFGMFLCLTLALVGHIAAQNDVVFISVVMAGALGGFLIFNFPPAKVFLGDGGAYLIGFFLASTSLLTSNKGSIIAALLVMLVALGVPILDTMFAILRRAIRGVPIFRADAEHIHHRLILLGYSKGQALIALYAICVALSLVGISILLTKGLALPVAGAALFVLAVAAARYLGYVRSWKGVRAQMSQALRRRRDIEYVNAHARLLELEVEKCDSPEEFAAWLEPSLKRMGLQAERQPDARAVDIPLVDGTVARVFRSAVEHDSLDLSLRVEALLPSFERAWERWKTIPGVSLIPAAAASKEPPTPAIPA